MKPVFGIRGGAVRVQSVQEDPILRIASKVSLLVSELCH